MRRYTERFPGVWLLTLLVSFPAFAQQEMWMSSTDANIEKRASKQPKPIFQIPLGHQHVESMQQLGGDMLILGLRKNAPRLEHAEYLVVDKTTGETKWRYPCGKGRYRIFWASGKRVLLKEDHKKRTTFISLDTHTGATSWTQSFALSDWEFTMDPDTEQLMAYSSEEEKILVRSIDLENGSTLWEQQLPNPGDGPPFLLVDENTIFAFTDVLTALSAESGAIIYESAEVSVGKLSPLLPHFEDAVLYVIDDGQKLIGIDKARGKILQRKSLPEGIRITNITSTSEYIFIRGSSENGVFQLIAFAKTKPEPLWAFKTNAPVTSNLIEHKDSLFFASASKLYALQTKTGEPLFTRTVTQTGRNFPISLRLAGENIVHIGELVIAGYKVNSGKLAFKHGFSPIDPNLHYNGLDASLPKLKKRLDASKEYASGEASQFNGSQQAYYQKMADKNYDDYLKYRRSPQPGTTYKANMARHRSRTYSSMARMQSGVDLGLSIVELGVALEQVIEDSGTEAEIRKQEYFRRAILEVYSNALVDNYVFRPNLKHFSTPDQYVCVSIINLSTGKKEDHYLSPQYTDYGLWNWVDYDERVIYHHGVGMDPSKYQLSKNRVAPLVRYKMVETFLIAQPFE